MNRPHIRRSLISPVSACMVRIMFAQVVRRKIAALTLALAVLLGGVAPSWAVTSASVKESMPGMAMIMADMTCAEMMKNSSPVKQVPGKSGDSSCATCVACAVNAGVPQGFSVTLLYQGEIHAASRNANRNDVATPPPLPPPILNA